ncbi:MAG: MMPL family transporter [Nanoarchaeota archaeon]|nr:MMPL family transporter [Nanoarchaeota archaeon]
MIEKLVKFQIKYSKFFLLLLVIIITSAAMIGSNLKIDPDFGILIPDDSEYNQNDRILKKAFETNQALVLYLSIDDKSTLKNIPNSMKDKEISIYLNNLNEVIAQSNYVTAISPVKFSENERSAQIIISLNAPEKVGGIGIVIKEIDNLIDGLGTPKGVTKTLTGFPVMIDRIPTLLIKDNLNTILITILAVFLILFWYSRDWFFTLVTVATPVTSLILLSALMVILGINITITLAAVGVLILGLGADYSIHISTHYAKARKEHENHTAALIHTVKRLALPITASYITTLAGFGALIFGVSPSSQSQGLVLAMGISVIYATTMILFPILMTVFAKNIHLKPNKVFDKILSFFGKLAVFQVKYAKTVIIFIFLITAVMIYGASKVQFSTSNSNWIPDDDPVSESFRGIVNDFGGNFDSIEIILISEKGDLRDVQVARDVNKLISQIKGIPYIDIISSPYDGLEYSENKIFEELTYNPNLRNQFNQDWTLTRIKIINRNLQQDEAGKSIVLKEVRAIVENNDVYNTKMSLYGNAVRFNELGDALEKDAGVTTLLGLTLVFFVASTVYASLAIGMLSLIPIILAVIWTVGLMGFFSIPFTSLSTGIISLVLGIGVDFSIHLVDGIKKYSRRYNFDKAVFETMSTSGKAIFLSSLTTFVGFLALTFAQLLGTQRLGWSLAFSIVSVFIVSILFVPSILKLLDNRNIKKLRKKELSKNI